MDAPSFHRRYLVLCFLIFLAQLVVVKRGFTCLEVSKSNSKSICKLGNRLLIVGARVYNPVLGQKGMTHMWCHKYGNNAPFMLGSNWVLDRSEAALPLIYYHSVFAEFATCRKFHLAVWDVTCL